MKSKFLKILIGVISLIAIFILTSIIVFSIVNRTNGKIISSGETRKYLLYIPKTNNPNEPVPLVINIHGLVQWPANQMRVSQWNDLADQYGFIVVYPMGTGFPLRWRVSEDPENPGGPDKEIAFYIDLIDKLESEYNIDSSRIYANGLSNGGGMSLLLACRLSDRITAIGGVAGAYLLTEEQCQTSRPVPAIFFHGKADKIVPFEGGSSERFPMPFPNIAEFAQSYAQNNGCEVEPETILDLANVMGIKYSGCRQDAEVIFFTIEDGGHTWPGGSPLPEWITGKTSQEIDATELMWTFFQQYSLGQ